MIIKYGVNIEKETILKSLDRLTNQIFKLLPLREEGGEWKPTLRNLIVEVSGMDSLLLDKIDFFSLLCKMEGLLTLENEDDFMMFRSSIFESLSLIARMKKNV